MSLKYMKGRVDRLNISNCAVAAGLQLVGLEMNLKHSYFFPPKYPPLESQCIITDEPIVLPP